MNTDRTDGESAPPRLAQKPPNSISTYINIISNHPDNNRLDRQQSTRPAIPAMARQGTSSPRHPSAPNDTSDPFLNQRQHEIADLLRPGDAQPRYLGQPLRAYSNPRNTSNQFTVRFPAVNQTPPAIATPPSYRVGLGKDALTVNFFRQQQPSFTLTSQEDISYYIHPSSPSGQDASNLASDLMESGQQDQFGDYSYPKVRFANIAPIRAAVPSDPSPAGFVSALSEADQIEQRQHKYLSSIIELDPQSHRGNIISSFKRNDTSIFDIPAAKRRKIESYTHISESESSFLHSEAEDAEDEEDETAGHGSPCGDNAPATATTIQTFDDAIENPPARLVDIGPYLYLPQKEAARRLGVPVSTLSKRWKDATEERKWPFRTLAKIDKEVMQILLSIPPGEEISEEQSVLVRRLLRQRLECLSPVSLRFSTNPEKKPDFF